MVQLWKSLPSWVRNVVVPVVALVLLWQVFTAVLGFVLALLVKVLIVVALGAVVVILVKKASRS